MKYGQKLPKKVEKELDAYIERIRAIKWFKPAENLDFKKVDKQIKFSLKCFGVEANIEYRDLKTQDDWTAAWDAARNAAWDATWNAAWAAAWTAARTTARDAAWAAARAAAWDAAWAAARAAADLLALNLKNYKKKYPKGNFVNLIPLWEMGLYPCGVVKGKFIIYIPKK